MRNCFGVVIPSAARNLLFFALATLLAGNGCGYPPFWDYARRQPKDADLVGTYTIKEQVGLTNRAGLDPNHYERLILNSDGTAELYQAAEIDSINEKVSCVLTGSGSWLTTGGPPQPFGIEIRVGPSTRKQSDKCTGGLDFWVLGQQKPYRLYQWIGDPDDDTGLLFKGEK